ncbi:MAG: RAMP superfamily CRISPR-associated protein [Elusimicrobiota bacterium]
MKRVTYTIKVISPLVLSVSGNANNVVYTKDYIPGSVIRGMLAGRYIQKKKIRNDAHKDNDFYNWFLGEKILFRNAYVTNFDKKNTNNKSIPTPLSLQHKKYNKSNKFDLLRQKPLMATKGISGYISPINFSQINLTVRKRLNYHHQRDPRKGIAKSGIFFNYESIEPNQIFKGEIIGQENHLNKLMSFFQNENIFFIGRSKNSQYGKINFEFQEGHESFRLNIKLNQKDVALVMVSPVIIFNENGFSTTDVNDIERVIQKYLGNNISITKSFIKQREIENYVSVWRLRKPNEVCFKEGTCFLLEGIEKKQEALLQSLQEEGIGERINEGFGQIRFFNQIPTQISDDRESVLAYDHEYPEQTQLILKEIIRNIIKDEIKRAAVREADSFTKLPSKSLMGRLEYMHKTGNLNISEIEQLKETAKNQLENSRNDNANLFEFIKQKLEESFSTKELLSNVNPKTDFVREIIKENVDLQSFLESLDSSVKLRDLYFQNFLIFLRKKRKISKGDKD